ncbi:MAG: hypothetical protein ACI841_004052 [Planctomycetota bacterium]
MQVQELWDVGARLLSDLLAQLDALIDPREGFFVIAFQAGQGRETVQAFREGEWFLVCVGDAYRVRALGQRASQIEAPRVPLQTVQQIDTSTQVRMGCRQMLLAQSQRFLMQRLRRVEVI